MTYLYRDVSTFSNMEYAEWDVMPIKNLGVFSVVESIVTNTWTFTNDILLGITIYFKCNEDAILFSLTCGDW